MKLEISLVPLITFIFMLLKLCAVITWSWWWVFSPVLIMVGLFAVYVFTAVVLRW